jgi:outer membrane protein assembly factor BamB
MIRHDRRQCVWLAVVATAGCAAAPAADTPAPAQTPARAVDQVAPPEAWPLARGGAASTGRSAATLRLPLAESWHREFPRTAFGAPPVIAGGTIYLGDLDGTFHALALDSGETRWTFTAEAAGFPSAAAVSIDPELPLVVVGDDAGIVRALDTKTGAVRWTHETGGEISGGPTILTAGLTAGLTAELIAGHARSGDAEPTAGAEQRVLVGSQDASLSCLRLADGAVVWTHSITDQIRCGPTVVEHDGAPLVLIAGCDGKLHVIDAATGAARAGVPIDGPTGTTPAADAEGRAYFGTEGGAFFAIDVATEAVAWRVSSVPAGQSYRSSAALADDVAIVGSRGRAVEAFARADGTRVWRQPLRGRVDASPVVVGISGDPAPPGGLAALATDAAGTIVVLDAGSGERLWQFDAGSGSSGGAAVAADRMVVATDQGTVWCWESATEATAPP